VAAKENQGTQFPTPTLSPSVGLRRKPLADKNAIGKHQQQPPQIKVTSDEEDGDRVPHRV
jgi:hypothetical protein